MNVWLQGLLTEIVNEHFWKQISLQEVQNTPDEYKIWNAVSWNAPFEKNDLESLQNIIETSNASSIEVTFESDTECDHMLFRADEGKTPEEQLYIWSMQGPLDRAFIRHWKRNQ